MQHRKWTVTDLHRIFISALVVLSLTAPLCPQALAQIHDSPSTPFVFVSPNYGSISKFHGEISTVGEADRKGHWLWGVVAGVGKKMRYLEVETIGSYGPKKLLRYSLGAGPAFQDDKVLGQVTVSTFHLAIPILPYVRAWSDAKVEAGIMLKIPLWG